MLCKVCNTRVPFSHTSCPNCGSPAPPEPKTRESIHTAALPGIQLPEPEPDPEPEKGDARESVEFEPEDSLELDEEVSGRPAVRARDGEAKEAVAVSQPARRVRSAHALGALDAAGVRRMLVERPEMLEEGLTIYKSEKGTALGAGYTSGVGEIDLLARDRAGDLVVVMVAEPREGTDIVSVMLQRIGWVRKHLSRNAKPVRGIVLLEAMPEDLAYAASAVSGTIAFKTYRVALAFEDVGI